MFKHFPSIKYPFSGGTFDVTNIFKSVNLVFDRESSVLTTTSLPGERPDQLSSRLYNDSRLFWSLFLVNGVRNPLRDWAQSQETYNSQIETEYFEWVYQFANISDFIPAAGSTGFTGDFLEPYSGTKLNGISVGDLLIYETGTGPFSIKCYGAGGVTSEASCGAPQYGQSIVPDNFNHQSDVIQISCGNYFSSCLDSAGYIYVWGKGITLSSTGFDTSGNLYQSRAGSYSFINASGERIVAVKEGKLECFGVCDDFSGVCGYSGQTGIVKTAWTNGLSGGVAIKADNTIINFGTSAPTGITFYDIDCGDRFCVGIRGTDGGLTAWGNNTYEQLNVPLGVTGITMISASYRHALALKSDGTVYGWGATADGQLVIPTGQYTSVSAGRSHSAAIDSDSKLSIWGKILKYGESACPGQTAERVTPAGLCGSFSFMNSGYDHVVLKGSGVNRRYIGVVETVDNIYKRIFVKPSQFPDTKSVLLDDPSGTIVSVWRYDDGGKQYNQTKTIQNQLLSIEKYLDTAKYVLVGGQIMNPATNNNWANVYIGEYQQANDNESFITPRKELLNVDLYNKTQTKQLSLLGVKNLESAIIDLMNSDSGNQIKISDL